MKALRLYGVGDIRLDDVPEPGEPGPGEVLVAPLWCGLCGTDAREFVGPGGSVPDEPHPLTGVHKPVVLGHEFSARVVAVGRGVTGVEPGTVIAVLPLVGCGTCRACRHGEPILCPTKAWIGLSTAFGGLGDLVRLPAALAVPIGDVSERDGALIEPCAVALHAVLQAGVRPGDTVLVAGCGPIGLLSAACALASGADRVLAYDPRTALAGAIEAIGAQQLTGTLDQQLTAVRDLTDGGVAVAIDCAGQPESLELCLRAVRPGGTVAVPAVHTKPREVNVWSLTRNTISVVGSLGYTARTWDRAIALIAAGRLKVGSVVTHTIERSGVAATLGAPPDAAPAKLKVLVRVSGS